MKYLLLACACLAAAALRAQSDETLVAPLRYLASDELKGRGFGRPELDIAADYIADQFKKAGAQPIPGTGSYFQPFDAESVQAEGKGRLSFNGRVFNMGGDARQWNPVDADIDAPVLFVKDTSAFSQPSVAGTVVILDSKALGDIMALPVIRGQLDRQGARALVVL